MSEDFIDFNEFTKIKFIEKAKKYCSYRDRCQFEVATKLKEWDVDENISEEIITALIIEKFLDEERFTRSFIRGKFRMNKWGKRKIVVALKQKRINSNLINYCLDEIDEEEYQNCLIEILEKKNKEISGNNKTLKIQKLRNYAFSRGFEYDLINEIITENF